MVISVVSCRSGSDTPKTPQVIEFTSTRSPDDRQSHDSWTCEAFLKVLYRQGRSFLGLREFIAFRQGLMTAFPEESDFAQVCSCR